MKTKSLFLIAVLVWVVVGGSYVILSNNVNLKTSVTGGDATVTVSASFNRTLTAAELSSLRVNIFTKGGSGLGDSGTYFVKDEPLGTYSIPAGSYSAAFTSSSIPGSLEEPGNPHKPHSWPKQFTISSGENQKLELSITLSAYNPQGDFPVAPDTEIPAIRSDFASIEFNKVFVDRTTDNIYQDSGRVFMKTLKLNNVNYLIHYLNGMLYAYDLSDPYNPNKVAEFNTATVTQCNITSNDFGVIEYNGKAVGFLNSHFCGMFFSFDPATNTIVPVMQRKLESDDKKMLPVNVSMHFDIMFKDKNGAPYLTGQLYYTDSEGEPLYGTDYSTGYSLIYRLDDVLAFDGSNQISPIINVDSLLDGIRTDGTNWGATCRVSGVVPKSFHSMQAQSVYYNGSNEPVVMYSFQERSEKFHNSDPYWTMAVTFPSITNPVRGFFAADDVMFTKQDCGDSSVVETGCDRTKAERNISFMNTYFRSTRIVDQETGNLYFPYQLAEKTTTSTQNVCMFTSPIQGDIRARNQFGINSLDDINIINRLAQPIVGSTHTPQGSHKVEEKTFTGVVDGASMSTVSYASSQNPLNVKHNIVLFSGTYEKGYNCWLSGDPTCRPQCLKKEKGKCIEYDHFNMYQMHVGFFDETRKIFAWITDPSDELNKWRANVAAPSFRHKMQASEILQISPTEYAVYVGRDESAEVLKLTFTADTATLDLSTVGNGTGDGLGSTAGDDTGTAPICSAPGSTYTMNGEAYTCSCSEVAGSCNCSCTPVAGGGSALKALNPLATGGTPTATITATPSTCTIAPGEIGCSTRFEFETSNIAEPKIQMIVKRSGIKYGCKDSNTIASKTTGNIVTTKGLILQIVPASDCTPTAKLGPVLAEVEAMGIAQ